MLVEQLTCGEKEVKRGWILSSLNWDPDVRLELTSIHNIIVYWRKILILTESYKEYSRIIITHKTIITHKMKYFLLEQIYDMICHWDFFYVEYIFMTIWQHGCERWKMYWMSTYKSLPWFLSHLSHVFFAPWTTTARGQQFLLSLLASEERKPM